MWGGVDRVPDRLTAKGQRCASARRLRAELLNPHHHAAPTGDIHRVRGPALHHGVRTSRRTSLIPGGDDTWRCYVFRVGKLWEVAQVCGRVLVCLAASRVAQVEVKGHQYR